MKIVIELLRQVRDREIDRYNAVRMLEQYKTDRETNTTNKARTDEGQLIKLKALEFLDKLKEHSVIIRLARLDSMSYYPLTMDGETYTMADRAKILNRLIEKIGA